MAAEAGMELFADILQKYACLPFSLPGGGLNPYTMIPLMTDMLTERGLKGEGGIEQVAGFNIYPPEWFNPFDDATGRLRKTPNTHSIHWYSKSWMEPEPRWKTELKRLARRIMGAENLSKLKLSRKG